MEIDFEKARKAVARLESQATTREDWRRVIELNKALRFAEKNYRANQDTDPYKERLNE